MAAAPVPVPVPAEAAAPEKMGNIFEGYQVGTINDMFAPAYIKGFAPSEKALSEWTAYNRQGPGIVEASRMPDLWTDPANAAMSAGDGVYGGPIPFTQKYGDNKGQIDPEALRIASQGGHYDLDARRAAIAARLAENARLQAAKPLAPPTGDGSAMATMSPDEYRRKIIGDHSGYWGEG